MKDNKNIVVTEKAKPNVKACGIIMPIASHPDYPRGHWSEVYEILKEAISETEFEPRIVSADDAIGLIHDRIVTNIYNDEIVICDVSSKNPNVMFELGLRLAFDKPTIIIKDEKTGYSFDTGGIEHLEYPSSLRFNLIVDFKAELIKRVNATYQKAKSEDDYSPFLKSFGKNIIPAKIRKTEIPEGKFIVEQLASLQNEVRAIRYENSKDHNWYKRSSKSSNDIKLLLARNVLSKLDLSDVSLSRKEIYSILNDELDKMKINLSNEEIDRLISDYIRSRNINNSA